MEGHRGGRLIYLVGPSGAGKDSLLAYAQQRLAADHSVRFARRYITRPAGYVGENHVALTPEQFVQRQALGLFAMTWQSHGLEYGIGSEIHDWMAQGQCVVVNGSRDYLPVAAERFASLEPVLVRADPAVLQARLAARGREAPDDVTRRLSLATQRNAALKHPRLIEIDNNGALEAAGERLVTLIRGDAT
jgi:ribose 1,5-bisphosphokinase